MILVLLRQHNYNADRYKFFKYYEYFSSLGLLDNLKNKLIYACDFIV